MSRYYYQCNWCLTTFVTEEKVRDARCAVCDRSVQCLGPVEGQRWVNEEYLAPCDGRCTGALGPKCNCKCRGENHGSGKVVAFVTDGGVVKLIPPDAAAATRAREIGEALDNLRNACAARYGLSYKQYSSGQWVSNKPHWYDLEWIFARVDDIFSLKTHTTRLARLAKLAAVVQNGNIYELRY